MFYSRFNLLAWFLGFVITTIANFIGKIYEMQFNFVMQQFLEQFLVKRYVISQELVLFLMLLEACSDKSSS